MGRSHEAARFAALCHECELPSRSVACACLALPTALVTRRAAASEQASSRRLRARKMPRVTRGWRARCWPCRCAREGARSRGQRSERCASRPGGPRGSAGRGASTGCVGWGREAVQVEPACWLHMLLMTAHEAGQLIDDSALRRGGQTRVSACRELPRIGTWLIIWKTWVSGWGGRRSWQRILLRDKHRSKVRMGPLPRFGATGPAATHGLRRDRPWSDAELQPRAATSRDCKSASDPRPLPPESTGSGGLTAPNPVKGRLHSPWHCSPRRGVRGKARRPRQSRWPYFRDTPPRPNPWQVPACMHPSLSPTPQSAPSPSRACKYHLWRTKTGPAAR